MEQSIAALQAGLLRDYYKWFSKYAKGKKPDKKVAWVTSFAPVEILCGGYSSKWKRTASA